MKYRLGSLAPDVLGISLTPTISENCGHYDDNQYDDHHGYDDADDADFLLQTERPPVTVSSQTFQHWSPRSQATYPSRLLLVLESFGRLYLGLPHIVDSLRHVILDAIDHSAL